MKIKHKKLIETIHNNLMFSDHALIRMQERLGLRLDDTQRLESIKRKLALGRTRYTLQKETGLIRMFHKGRYFIDRNFVIVTYMTPRHKTNETTIKNHNKIYTYIPMIYEDIVEYFNIK